MMVVEHWSRLAIEVVNVPSLETFRVVTPVCRIVDGGWTRGALEFPSTADGSVLGGFGPGDGLAAHAGCGDSAAPGPGPATPQRSAEPGGARPWRHEWRTGAAGGAVTSRAARAVAGGGAEAPLGVAVAGRRRAGPQRGYKAGAGRGGRRHLVRSRPAPLFCRARRCRAEFAPSGAGRSRAPPPSGSPRSVVAGPGVAALP